MFAEDIDDILSLSFLIEIGECLEDKASLIDYMHSIGRGLFIC